MNNKGQTAMLGIMFAMMFLITGVVLIEPVKEVITTARSASYLDCGNAANPTGTKMTCILVDWYLPYFIGTVFAVGIGYIGLRRLNNPNEG